MAAIGTGTTIVFGTSGFSAEVVGINLSDISRVAINSSHLGSTSAHSFIFGDLVDWGNAELEINYDPTDFPPVGEAAETITITTPDSTTYVFSGAVTNVSAAIPLEDKMTATVTVKAAGAVTIT